MSHFTITLTDKGKMYKPAPIDRKKRPLKYPKKAVTIEQYQKHFSSL